MLNEGLEILDAVGIPISNQTERRLEKYAMCFLAVAHIVDEWRHAKSASDGEFLQSRKVIEFINKHFEESISSGSYDTIRRKDLKLPVLAGLIVNSGKSQGLATNDSTRGYALSDEFADLVRKFGTSEWVASLEVFKSQNRNLSKELARERDIDQIPVSLPNGQKLQLSFGEHNQLQKAIIEEFLPRFGFGAQVLYVGDTSKKTLIKYQDQLENLGFFDLNHDQLPDIVAFSKERQWLYLIEAVHSSGPLSEVRLLELKENLKSCKVPMVFVTAFLTRGEFRKWAADIGWESEVWIADNPDHMIHFNGDKFLGPYSPT